MTQRVPLKATIDDGGSDERPVGRRHPLGPGAGQDGPVAGRPQRGVPRPGAGRAAAVGRVPAPVPGDAGRARLHPGRDRGPVAARAGRLPGRRLRGRGAAPPAGMRPRRPAAGAAGPGVCGGFAGLRGRPCSQVDRAAFPPFWQFDAHGLDEALRATPRTRFRAAVGPGEGGAAVVGYAICGRSGSRGFVQRLAVHPDAHRQGIGRGLLLDGLRWMRRRGVRRAVVNTQLGNDAALSALPADRVPTGAGRPVGAVGRPALSRPARATRRAGRAGWRGGRGRRPAWPPAWRWAPRRPEPSPHRLPVPGNNLTLTAQTAWVPSLTNGLFHLGVSVTTPDPHRTRGWR